MTEKDPLALWRDKQELSLSEAAALMADARPRKTYSAKDLSPTERDERDAVTANLHELLGAVAAKTLEARLAYSTRVTGTDIAGNSYVRCEGGSVLPDKSMVSREAVKGWLTQHKPSFRPAFFFPAEGGKVSDANLAASLRVVWALKELLKEKSTGFAKQDALAATIADKFPNRGVGERLVKGVFSAANAAMKVADPK